MQLTYFYFDFLRTPLTLAMSLHNKEVIKCLKFFGAKESFEIEENNTAYSNVSTEMDN